MNRAPTEQWLTRPGGLAGRLRGSRNRVKLNGKEFAERAQWQPSKVSRLETGKHVPTAEDIDTYVRLCGLNETGAAELHALLDEVLTAQMTWNQRLKSGQVAVQQDYNQLVAESDRICHFETMWVPGLLQTPEYARQTFAGIAALHGTSADEVEAAVSARMERQRYLYDTSKTFEFLLAEPVLRWLLCPPDVMRGQLDRLQTVVGLPNVRFGVLPLGVQLRTAPQNAFQIYGDLAVVETFVTEDFHRDEKARKYEEILAMLWEEAAVGEDARPLIVAAADSLP
ncbi:helix-turn-helix domain-containing protein [Plantactinospora sp. WMMB782]|uniref:helix-turn-helix domain-containing protein n=1 Tax=Plantactinospora sp. WMMB782 TaxID=3404121 RepID=UPI003B93C898